MRKSSILAVALLSGLVLAPRLAGAIAIGFVPNAQMVGVGASVSVDVVVSGLESGGLDEIVAAFDLDVSYDPLVVAATGVSFGGDLGGPGEVLTAFDLGTAGLVDLAALSLLSDATLQGLQGDAVTLATLEFSALALGTSPLEILAALPFGVDVKGLENVILSFETVGAGSIEVVVPEPATLALVATGLVGLARASRRRPAPTL
jgi:hypothetical protein